MPCMLCDMLWYVLQHIAVRPVSLMEYVHQQVFVCCWQRMHDEIESWRVQVLRQSCPRHLQPTHDQRSACVPGIVHLRHTLASTLRSSPCARGGAGSPRVLKSAGGRLLTTGPPGT